jgi:hypothetical protein
MVIEFVTGRLTITLHLVARAIASPDCLRPLLWHLKLPLFLIFSKPTNFKLFFSPSPLRTQFHILIFFLDFVLLCAHNFFLFSLSFNSFFSFLSYLLFHLGRVD